MIAIFKKEFRNYFMSPIGYIFVAVFTFLASMFFTSGILMSQKADISIMFSDINLIYLFLAALLTMRLLSEEKNKKTDQLLLSSPVGVTEIVMGKYLAAMAVFGVTIIISLVYPAIMFKFGNPSVSEVIGSYIGFILLWGAFIAVGVFISSLTESQIVAAIVSIGSGLLISYIDTIAGSIGIDFVQSILSSISFTTPYQNFAVGLIRLSDIIFFLSVSTLFNFFTVKVLERRRWN